MKSTVYLPDLRTALPAGSTFPSVGGRVREMPAGSGAGFQPVAAGHLARMPNTGWKPEPAGKMPAPLLVADM